MSAKANAETFRSIPIFSDCDPVHLQVLAFSAVRQNFADGEVVIKRGLKGAAAYLILSGRADIFGDGTDRIGTVGPGAMLGEVAMIGDNPYAVTARASEDMSTARIDRVLFMRIANEYPEFGTAVFNALAQKLGIAMDDLEQVRHAFDQAKSFRNL